jgi:hypothetical protein
MNDTQKPEISGFKIGPNDIRRFAKFLMTRESGCVEWSGSIQRQGYGTFKQGGKRGKAVLAHRFAWTSVHGTIPAGLHVLHSCDNKICCNVEHLSLGCPLDNAIDKAIKNRGAKSRRGLPYGVQPQSSSGRFRAAIRSRRQAYKLGTSGCIEELHQRALFVKIVLLGLEFLG